MNATNVISTWTKLEGRMADNIFILFYEIISMLANLINVLQFIYDIYQDISNRLRQNNVFWDTESNVTQSDWHSFAHPEWNSVTRDVYWDQVRGDVEWNLAARDGRWDLVTREGGWIPGTRDVGTSTRQFTTWSATESLDDRDIIGDAFRDLDLQATEVDNSSSRPPVALRDSGDCRCSMHAKRKVPMMKVLSDSKKMLRLRASKSAHNQALQVNRNTHRELGIQVNLPQSPKAARKRSESRNRPISSSGSPVRSIVHLFENPPQSCNCTPSTICLHNECVKRHVASPSNRLISEGDSDDEPVPETPCGELKNLLKRVKTKRICLDKHHNFLHRPQLHKTFQRQASLLKGSTTKKSNKSSKRMRKSEDVDKISSSGPCSSVSRSPEDTTSGARKRKRMQGTMDAEQTTCMSLKKTIATRNQDVTVLPQRQDFLETDSSMPRYKWSEVVHKQVARRLNERDNLTKPDDQPNPRGAGAKLTGRRVNSVDTKTEAGHTRSLSVPRGRSTSTARTKDNKMTIRSLVKTLSKTSGQVSDTTDTKKKS
ncbi:hypothetical protein BgiMline_023260 [Biomphalaria glabrata]|nr:hypothetical protein BgiMline_011052 [Biomphalaria glabrata]